MRTRVPLFLLLISAINHAAADDDHFRPLFNGADFSGWVRTNTPPETWTYRDGMVVCSGQPIGEIRTDRMYQNFILELEWRHMVPRGNAGVFIWADDITAPGVPFHRGIEVQVLENAYGNTRSHTTHGDIFPIHGAKMTPVNGRGGSRAFPTEERSNPSPQWNHYRIECRDGKISLAVNGKVVTRGTDCWPRKGYICLESEGGVVHYRNVRLKELPDTPIQEDQIAIASRGYRSVYSGLDLRGWHADDSEAWSANNWVLKHTGKETSTLKLKESVDQIGAVVDVKLSKEATASLQAGPYQVDLADDAVVNLLADPGRWNRFEFTQQKDQPVVLINGTPHDLEIAETSHGSLTLTASGPVDFCNIYVRSQH